MKHCAACGYQSKTGDVPCNMCGGMDWVGAGTMPGKPAPAPAPFMPDPAPEPPKPSRPSRRKKSKKASE